jgi:predicted NBD/HSP70 family sugar kinase
VVFAPNLGWRDVPLAAMLRDRLAVDVSLPVLVANEADLGALAEARRGAARGVDDVLYLSGEVGVGGGLLVGGRPLVGASGFGGEVGHMVVDPTGTRCHCGSTGCWETEIGEVAVLRRAGRRRRAGVDAIGQLVAAADAGDIAARAAAEATGHWLGLGVGSLINILNPRMVVLGGLFGRLHDHLRAAMMAELARRSLAPIRGDVTVVASELGEQAALVGAAELAFDAVLDDPLNVERLRR